MPDGIRTPTPSRAVSRRDNRDGSAGTPPPLPPPPPPPMPLVRRRSRAPTPSRAVRRRANRDNSAEASQVAAVVVPAPLQLPPAFSLPMLVLQSTEIPTLLASPMTLLFDVDVANGTPTQWCRDTIYWGKRTKKNYFANVISTVPDINDFLSFLHMRLGPDGRPVTYKLGEPQEIEIGLWRLPWKDFEEPTGAMGPRDGSWERAWHGTKLEALYSIMFHGQLCASHMEGSHRFFPNKPGVYCHGDYTQDKAASYARFVSLTQSGFVWSVTWELRVDRSDRVPLSKCSKDQWAQTEKSCRLAALWVRGRSTIDMEKSLPLAQHWIPEHEANPIKQQFAADG